MRRIVNRSLVAVALLGACLGFGAQVAQAGGGAPQLLTPPGSIEAGAVSSLTVTNFDSFGCPLTEDIVVFVTPSAGGTTTLLVTIPGTLIVGGQATVQFTAPGSPGNFSVVAERDDGDASCQARSTLEVTAASTTTAPTTTAAPTTTPAPTTTAGPTTSAAAVVPPTTASQLPATGASSSNTWMAIAALVFLVMGSALLAVRRRPG